MRLFKIARDVLTLSQTFNPNAISKMFPPGHPNKSEAQKYREAITFYYTVSTQVRGVDQAAKANLFNECGQLLSNIQAEPLDSFMAHLNAKIAEIKSAKLTVRPLI